MSGRVKTLHPGVHGGILAKREEEQHMAAISQHSISPIDVVVVNLYTFRQTVTAQQAPSYEPAVENIDIGGNAVDERHLCFTLCINHMCLPMLNHK